MPDSRTRDDVIEQYLEDVLQGRIQAEVDQRRLTRLLQWFGRQRCRHQWFRLANRTGLMFDRELTYCRHCLLMGEWWCFASSESDWHFKVLADPLGFGEVD